GPHRADGQADRDQEPPRRGLRAGFHRGLGGIAVDRPGAILRLAGPGLGGSPMKSTAVRTADIAGNFPCVLLRIETDAGITGLGEAYWGAVVAELVQRAKPLLIGEDPTNIARLVFLMERSLSGEGAQGGVTCTAISVIEIALWDLMGRAH